ncbi:MAG: hemolysin III family protein [Candidatus Cloacimonetes bacterium]|jgi:hemolysin III|nr:hemolysin III family protein [Candidatus Cloacimonadota bacterium]MDY0337337.1 hemolysin III family protein [Candidatus Cloacimonadaceae bacterium]MCB5270095.1 hemolysin III family protein [Candidatus Cloacimonadota bacterium]MCK9334207.1 hemolysin III family protein [Candidatus Cloacimonadota bacterium]MDD2543833.1 hemolysin III family protein [Candidatus Cloacimonadota bacterium]
MSKDRFLDRIPLSPKQSLPEEIANAITHGVGVGLAIAALVVLVVHAARISDTWKIVSFSIYGATMIILFLSSTLYHSFPQPYLKRFFRILDHSSIFLLIAGTYTPVTIGSMRGGWGWSLFGVIWGLTLIGIVLKIFAMSKLKWLSIVVYLTMGWIILIAIKPLIAVVSRDFLIWILAGGLAYSLGIVFYVARKIPFHHAVWHLFVLAGSFFHFLAMLSLI